MMTSMPASCRRRTISLNSSMLPRSVRKRGAGGEEAQRVVAPVVPEPLVHEVAVVEERLHRQQLHRRHAELRQVLDHPSLGHPLEGAAQAGGDVGVARGHALDVGLVDDRARPGGVRTPFVAPAVRGVGDHAFGHDEGAVAPVVGQIPPRRTDAVAEERVVPAQVAVQRQRIGVQKQLVGVEAVPRLGRVGAMDAVAVELAGPDAGEVAVPDLVGVLRQRDAVRLAPPRAVEEAELDAGGVGREEGEVHPRAVPVGAEGKVRPRLRRAVGHEILAWSSVSAR